MTKKRKQSWRARREYSRNRMREKRKQEKEIMSVKKGSLEMAFGGIDKEVFYSDEYEGNGADVRRYGGENSVGTRLEETNVAPYSRATITSETDVRNNEDMGQPHNVLQHSTTLGVELEVHQGSQHDPHSSVSTKCETDVCGSEDVLECQSHENDVCDSGATVVAESQDYPESECEETGEFGDEVPYRIYLNDDWGMYPCSACDMEFTRKSHMIAHLTSAHPGYKPFACEVCKKTFALTQRLTKHMITHTRRKPYACCYCDMKFWWKHSLKSHERIHYVEKSYACRRCGMMFSRKTALNLHKRIHYNETNYTCDLCLKKFIYKAQLIRHFKNKCYWDLRRIRNGEIPPVTACVPLIQTCSVEFEAGKSNDTPVERIKSLSNLTGIKVDKSSKFEIEDIMFADKCEKDGQTHTDEIPSATVCTPHMQKDGKAEEITVGPGKNSPADVNMKTDPTDLATEFNEMKRSKSRIDENILSVDEVKKEYPESGTEIIVSAHNDMSSDLSVGTRHVDRNPVSNNCRTDLSVNSRSQISDIHQSKSNAGCSTIPFGTFPFIKILKYPRKEKTHECLHCDKKFTTRDGVITHQITHTGEKLFSCKVCEKRFSRLSALKNHQIIHPSVKPLSCSDCGMEFRDRHKFSNHRKMKCAGDKPYPCMVCSKRFLYKCQLVNHFRNHTNEKPFVCHECDKRFTQAVGLKQHMRIHTGEKPFACTVCDKKFHRKKDLNIHCTTNCVTYSL